MDSTIIGGLLGIIAIFLGGLFRIYLARRNARREAGKKLIEEFAKISVFFDKAAISEPQAIDPILREAFPILKEKILIFKRHLLLCLHSTSKCNSGYLKGRFVAQAFPGPVVNQ